MVNIKIENLSKKFGDKEVLKSINLEIKKNEIYVLLGTSGCGKTTLLEIIAGLQSQDGGSIYFDDEEISKYEPSMRGISMVFQNYALYPNMNVYKNIEFPLKIKKEKKTNRKKIVSKMIDIVNLNDRKNEYVHNLSGGEKQRVAIARALVTNPKIFLLDEPLSNLDINLRAKMRREIVSINKNSNTTMIYVTHDQNEAINIADKIVVMNSGYIMQTGTVEEILFSPKNIFVFEFFNKGRINILDRTEANNIFNLKSKNYFSIAFKSEDIIINEQGFEGIIEEIEFFEHYKLIKILYKNKELLISEKLNSNYSVGEKIYFDLDMEKILYFDKEGNRLN